MEMVNRLSGFLDIFSHWDPMFEAEIFGFYLRSRCLIKVIVCWRIQNIDFRDCPVF